MKNILLLLFALCISSFSLQAQKVVESANAFSEKSDPEAKKILKKLSDQYKSSSGIKAEFSLIIENGDDTEVQAGKVFQKGDKFRFILEGTEVICDGETLWLKQGNNVQINNYDPEENIEFMSPNKIFQIYEAEKDFFYAITKKDSKTTSIEFKPRDRDSDYMKMRLEIDNSKNEVKSIKIFEKEGGRYTLKIKSLSSESFKDSYFKFDKSKYPGVDIEDMRI